MDVSQVLNHINDNNYDDEITVTEVSKDHFLAVTANTYDPDTSLRNIRVEILPIADGLGGTKNVNSGLFVRKEGETAVKVTVHQDGRELADNTQAYS